MKTLITLLIVLQQLSLSLFANVWQWSAEVKAVVSAETNDHPRAFLWIPANCSHVNAVVIANHNMLEEGIMEHPAFRKNMIRLGMAMVWITPGLGAAWSGDESLKTYNDILNILAEVSGYEELSYAPVIPLGHSAYATFPWNYAAWNPGRTLAIISVKGDAPQTHLTGYGQTNIDWGSRNIDGIPGLMVMSEQEWWEERLSPVFRFNQKYPSACISVLSDVGRGHFDISDAFINYLGLFIEKSVQYRLSQTFETNKQLIKIIPQKGWMVERWTPGKFNYKTISPFSTNEILEEKTFWSFDKEMASATLKYHNREKGKTRPYIGFEQSGTLLPFAEKSHANYHLNFIPQSDGLSFHVKAMIVDTTRNFRINPKQRVQISRICGPVKKINDSTFQIQFYRMGMNNSKRSGDIWLLAHYQGNNKMRSSVQQANLRIPLSFEQGLVSRISFDSLPNINLKNKIIKLKATSSLGLPVGFYVVDGPAVVKNNLLYIEAIPPKTKFPLRVTVTAWQYGNRTTGIHSAKPVTRSFYIVQ